jgi:hypothetical protein
VTDSILEALSLEVKNLAADSRIDFYLDFQKYHSISKTLFFTNPLVGRCKNDVLPYFESHVGNGVEHAKKVAIDAGTLILVEGRGWDPVQIKRWSLLAQLAGLIHDIHAPQPDHAARAAATARQIVACYPLPDVEKEAIVFAVEHHENLFGDGCTMPSVYRWVSNALHDADRFRWSLDSLKASLIGAGSGNREQTVCAMRLQLSKEIQKIRSIASTFKTGTGQRYGQQFINAGLAIGEHLQQRLHDQVSLEKTGSHPSPADHSL